MKKTLAIIALISAAIVTISAVRQTEKYNIVAEIQDFDLKKSIERGQEIYGGFCAQCHLPNGKGIPGTFPPLAGSDWLKNKRTESIHSVKYGLKGTITVNGQTYQQMMPNPGLENDEVADVMNYIMNSWGNTQEKSVTPDEVISIAK